jgi:ligand-binding SRPBCC domain-containing protein
METNVNPTISPLGEGYQLQQSQTFDRDVESMFDFFEDPENLERITPPRLQFSVKGYDPKPVQEGTIIEYNLKLHGIPIRWTSEIVDYEPNHHFTDRMLQGPYRKWEHIHTFERIQGQTVVGDQVHYEIPYGWFGEIAHRLFVKSDLEHIFEYRAETLSEIFN